MTGNAEKQCAACGTPIKSIKVIAGLRRSECRSCGHSERLDIEPFDYGQFAMGSTGVADKRTAAQAHFIAPYIPAGGRLLEIGCAAGTLATAIRACSNVTRYDGVEFSPARTIAAQILDNVHERPLDDLMNDNKIVENSYDVVLASHCLEHVEEPARLVASMSRALQPAGAFFIEVPNMSGHPTLLFDDNRSHIHFFSIASMSRMLINQGFQVVACATGARLDSRYPDSIRMIAQRVGGAERSRYPLSDAPAMRAEDRIVIWGAGRMADEMIAHYFDSARIAYFVDRDPNKHGQTRCGAPVRAPESLRDDAGRLVLINSLEMEAEIRRQIETEFADVDLRLIGLSTLLDSASPNRS